MMRRRTRWVAPLVVALVSAPAAAQQRPSPDSITIATWKHDVAWAVAGGFVTLTLNELGVPRRVSELLGGPGLALVSFAVKCTELCGHPGWPFRVWGPDLLWEAWTASSATPVLEGKLHGLRVGLALGVAYSGGTVGLMLARAKSP
jgi:hypothetical protein